MPVLTEMAPAVALPVPGPQGLAVAALGLALAALAAWRAWRIDPAWPISIGAVLTCMSGNWSHIGIPGALAPDRYLLLFGVAAALFGPYSKDRPVRLNGVHLLLLLALAYAGLSALLADTLFERSAAFKLVERFGLLPFALYLVAPSVFASARQRQILLGSFTALGAYLAITAVFEMAGPAALIFPQFIDDPDIGIHVGRARGPFLEAVTNGFALYIAGGAAAMYALNARTPLARGIGGAVVLLCVVGLFLTLQRSVWLGGVVATTLVLLMTRETRRLVFPAAIGTLVIVLVALFAVPGLSERASERRVQQDTVWDRQNLARAAVNMVEERPLLGFGWGRFERDSIERFEQADDYPLTGAGQPTHNVFLNYAAELGLVGVGLWVAALLAALGRLVMLRGPPDNRNWRLSVLALTVFWLSVASFVVPQVFVALALWLWIGVASAGLEPEPVRVRAVRAVPAT